MNHLDVKRKKGRRIEWRKKKRESRASIVCCDMGGNDQGCKKSRPYQPFCCVVNGHFMKQSKLEKEGNNGGDQIEGEA